MKKNIILTAILVLCTAVTALAGPAYPGRITVTQPDGTTINIRLHGDEYFHWATDDAGNILEQDEKGFWSISSTMTRSTLGKLQEEAAARRAAANEAFKAAASSAANFGSPKIPVILVGFNGNGEGFTKTNADFNAMLNTPGYSANNAIGSVFDYFNENSLGQFTPVFEVLGPVTVDNSKSYYGGNTSSTQGSDARPEMALVHAAQKLDSTVDFSRYDNDGDGTVDFVLFYFAGYDEAQGGSTSCIWSHAWYLSSSSNVTSSGRKFDGVYLNRYFCTAELKSNSGSTMCSIGTTCHEFAHTLGLPDFYDADYSTNGTAADMYTLDIMASGSYNVNSTTPPYFNAEELTEIGWLSSIPELTSTGSFTLPQVNYPDATSYSAYRTKTSVNNEYFVYECRGGQRWDAGIPTGMMVYHVDKSTNRVSGSTTAASLWNNNSVNNYSAHPCCYVVPAAKPTSTSYYSGSNFMFGSGSYKSYTPTAWNGNTTGFAFTNITYNSSSRTVTFNVKNSNTLGISGAVFNSDGDPISGVTITATPGSGVSSAPSKVASKSGSRLVNSFRMLFRPAKKNQLPATRAASYSAVTDADGYFMIETPAGSYQVTATLDGYKTQTATVEVTSVIESISFYLLREGETLPETIYAWPVDILTEEDEYIAGASINSITGQNLYPASELGKYAGKHLKEFTFYLYGDDNTTYEGLNVIIDFDDERKATVPVSNPTIGGYTTVDLRDLEIVIPANKDIYAGVGYSSGGYLYENAYYSFGAFYKTDEDENYYDWAVGWPYDGLVSEYNTTSTGTRYSWDLIFDFTLTVGDYEAPDTGYNYIADPGNGSYSAGESFSLTLVETTGDRKPSGAIQWYYDDEPVSGQSVRLTSGTHTVAARFTTTEGNTKVVELELNVQ
ncbi:MAG: M6 family metalloprotease domain-containing protein [Bacteroidales bacterium]|nr:M6 family metalloprotease domain-containing protein [Bacteroidales bacterium]